jgi:hypothetical protein
MQKHVAAFFLSIISIVGEAAGQSAKGLPVKTSPEALRGVISGSDLFVHLLALPGGAPVLGGETGQGMVDLGDASYAAAQLGSVSIERHGQYFTISTRFGLKLEKQNGGGAGAATLSAYLDHPDSTCSFFVDGIQLNAIPKVISARMRLGNLSEIRLEIRVPNSMPAGPLRTSVGWIAMPTVN